jgi:hypothetical protein
MANEQDYSALEVRVKKLEDQLAQSRAQRLPADVSPEEFQAYLKVRSALAYDNCGGGGTHCGPGCEYVRCMARCDVECICGPCNFGGGGFGGGGNFGGGFGGGLGGGGLGGGGFGNLGGGGGFGGKGFGFNGGFGL